MSEPSKPSNAAPSGPGPSSSGAPEGAAAQGGEAVPGFEDEELPRQFGKYTLLRALAVGGMAKVYLALQRAVAGFEKLVVIKRILPELSRDAGFVEMLLSEAKTAATLNHPNVVQTFDVGEVDGTYYIAMEHINGEDIRSIVRGMKRRGVTEFPLEHTLQIVLGACAGLSYAHDKRDLDGKPMEIVHRDISPQNILVSFTGDVKIVDFGIAKTSEVAIGESTRGGQLKGKVPYMSPEQASGDEIDHRSDIFALGIILFELSTGRRLFKAKSEFETLKLICERDYPRPTQIRPDYSEGLEAIVMKALEKDPEKRYQSADQMHADLEQLIREERMACSAVSLGKWMKMLFEDTIAEREEALQDVKQLADVIASQRSAELDNYTHTGTTTTGALTQSGTDLAAYTDPGQRKGRVWMGVGIAVAAAALGGVGLFVTMGPNSASSPAAAAPEGAGTGSVESDAPDKRGRLVVHTDPPGAYVRVAGELQNDKTPTTIDKLPLDMDFEVKISKDGYEDHLETVQLSEDDREGELDVELRKGTVTVEFEVVPESASVHVDGKEWDGEGNVIEELSAGEHKVVFAAVGHLPQVVKFTAEKGETKKLDVTLKKGNAAPLKQPSGTDDEPANDGPPGTVNVNSRGGFCQNVVVGGSSVGPTPVAGISVPPGPVSIVCKLADGGTVGSGTVVKSGQTSRVTITIPNEEK